MGLLDHRDYVHEHGQPPGSHQDGEEDSEAQAHDRTAQTAEGSHRGVDGGGDINGRLE